MTGRDRYFAQRARYARFHGKWAYVFNPDGSIAYIALRSFYGRRSKRRGKVRF